MRDRDVAAFDRRAAGYEAGTRGRLHQRIAETVAEIALDSVRAPQRVLDVGCGTGVLLRVLATRLVEAEAFVGVDPAPHMVSVAAAASGFDPRVSVQSGIAEALPFSSGEFDLVVSTTSFDHWADQARGLGECARVLRPGAPLVLCDLFSPVLLPTLLLGRSGRARTTARAQTLLVAAGFEPPTWHPTLQMLKTFVAFRSSR